MTKTVRKNAFMRLLVVLTVSILTTFGASGQIYSDASSQLPTGGADGQSMDVNAVDVDNDGDADIVLANEFQINTILYNDGIGNFTKAGVDILPQIVRDSEDVIADDFNGDGHLDLIFCSEDDIVLGATGVHEFYLGQDDGTWTQASFRFPDSEANAVIKAFINDDTLPDVLFGNNGPTTIFINNGDGSFTDESEDRIPSINRTTQDLHIVDIDQDGDQDLIEGNENGNIVYVNNGNGVFMDETSTRYPMELNLETRKISSSDIDGDGDIDLFLSNVEFIAGRNRQNRLLINDGEGNFTDESSTLLPVDSDHTIDAIFEDVDDDSDVDLILANVFGGPIKVYINDGEGKFSDQTLEVLDQHFFRDALGVIAADLNGDGLKDIYICDRNTGSGNKDLLLTRNLINSSIQPENHPDVILYPNPVSGQVFFNSPSRPLSISRIDSSGRKYPLSFEEIAPSRYVIDFSAQTLSLNESYLELIFSDHKIVKPVIIKK